MKVELFEHNGEVISADEFVRKYIDSVNLNNLEKQMLQEAHLTRNIPDFLRKPRAISTRLKGKSDSIIMEKRGSRSAYWPEKNIKFKGCNPADSSKKFPSESFFFGREKANVSEIPYGTLTKEQALREILGHAFFAKYGLKTNITPICVYTQDYGYSLAEHTLSEARIESCFDFKGNNINSITLQDAARKKHKLTYSLGTEVNLDRVNICWYTHKKALLLAAMNFNGGFRDLLNSNIGNDVLEFSAGPIELYLCDFDTFRVVELPNTPNKDFLKKFYLQCFVEAVKSSLPIIDYVRDSGEAVTSYLETSSLYHIYKREFYSQAIRRGWDLSTLEETEEWAISTPIFRRTASEIVPSYERLKTMPYHTPIYKPH